MFRVKEISKSKRELLKSRLDKENAESKAFKEEMFNEMRVKEALIKKLTERNVLLENLMKKAVKIM